MKYTINKVLYIFALFLITAVTLGVVADSDAAYAADQTTQGRLFLVSTGVGDPDLITLRAIDTLKQSDIIICHKNSADEFAQYVKGKKILDYGLRGWRTYKKDCSSIKDKKQRAQCEENVRERDRLIADMRTALAEGKTLSVLGSGDLMIYGGPYHWFLAEFADAHPKIIPGVSCFNAANAALGKELMQGKNIHSTVLTTYRDMDKLSSHHPTMVIFTMHTDFKDLVDKLNTLYPPKTPIAIVFHAGYKEKEEIVSGRLDTILKITDGTKFPFEHLVYVGDFLSDEK